MAPLLLPLLLLPVMLLLGATDGFPASCSKATCAGLDVRYPFWLTSSGPRCGYPGLGLTCDNNDSLILSVQSHNYKVVRIDYSNHIIAVSDTDAGDEYGSGCPRLHWNLTIDYTSSWLQLAPSDSNVTFLYNCKKNISSSYAVELSACRGGYGNNRSYVLLDGVTTGAEAYEHECEEVVVAPVLSVHKTGMMGAPGGTPPLTNGSLGPGGVVSAGFELMYTHSKQCDRCESSGGWCGYQRSESPNSEMVFTCFCDHETYSDHCEVGRPSQRGSNSSYYCGYPGLGILCEDGKKAVVLQLGGDNYRILRIDYKNFTVSLADQEVFNDWSCPRVHHRDAPTDLVIELS